MHHSVAEMLSHHLHDVDKFITLFLQQLTSIVKIKNKSMLFRISIIIAVITVSKAFAQLQIDSNYDSGNIGSYTIDGNDIEFIINSDALNYTYWTNFKVSNVLNQQITFTITISTSDHLWPI